MSDISPAFKAMREAGLAAMKAANEKVIEADRLIAAAKINDAYASAMEKCGGAERSPLAYAAHIQAAADKRARAAHLMS